MKFQLPVKFNGTRLRNELSAQGINLPEDLNAITVSDNDLFLDINQEDMEKVEEILANHTGEDLIIEETLENKLAKVGLSIDDLKTALGL
jgi:hypothetical protein